jgi:DNA repair protein RadA/Sms
MKLRSMILKRDLTGLPPLDHVLGGGLAEASVVLFAASPGLGKTSLTLQLLKGLGHRCLFASGEATREQIVETARRIGATSPQVHVLAEQRLEKILVHARELRARTIAIDTIQKIVCEDASGRAGSPGQLRECVERLVDFAKNNNTSAWLVGHVTSGGAVAGPACLEHDVDVVLELEQGKRLDGKERILRCPSKNRFGDTCRAGHFELTGRGFVPLDVEGST